MLRSLARAFRARLRPLGELGQSTTEYVLVLVVAATVSLLLLNWAKGGAITAFFEATFNKVTAMFA